MNITDKVLGAGNRAAKRSRTIAGWTLQLKGDVVTKMANAEDLNKQSYHTLVDNAAARYGRLKRVSAFELEHTVEELKSAWAHIGKQLG